MKDVQMKMYMLAPRLTFYKQLGLGFSLQSCLYFQDFWGSKLLNGCLVVQTIVFLANIGLRGIQQFSIDLKLIFMISDCKTFPILLLIQLNFVHCQFNSYFSFIAKEKLYFSLICSFYCCLVKESLPMNFAWQFYFR